MISVTIDPTEVRPPPGKARRTRKGALRLALPLSLGLFGVATAGAVAFWPVEKPVQPPQPVRAAATNIADWPEIKDGVPELVSAPARAVGETTASVVSRAVAEPRPSPASTLTSAQPATPFRTGASARFVPAQGGDGPVSPAPFEPAAPPSQSPASGQPAAAAADELRRSSPLPAAQPAAEPVVQASVIPADSAGDAAASPALPAPPVAVPPQAAPASPTLPDPALPAEVAPPAVSGLRGPVSGATAEAPASPPRHGVKKVKAEARKEPVQDASAAAKPSAKKRQVAAAATKPETGPAAQGGAASPGTKAAAQNEPAKAAADEDRVRVFGMTLPGFVPTGRKIKESVGNLGDAVMSLPGKL